MKIQYFSDLHLEFFTQKKLDKLFKIIEKKASILALCGDIGYPEQLLYEQFLSRLSAMDYKKIFIISGNHEYYKMEKMEKMENSRIQRTMIQTENKIKEICSRYSNVSIYKILMKITKDIVLRALLYGPIYQTQSSSTMIFTISAKCL